MERQRFGFYMKYSKSKGTVAVKFIVSNAIAPTLINELKQVPQEQLRDMKVTEGALYTDIEFTTSDINWANKLHHAALRVYRQNSNIGDMCLN